jgi:hypothetical protein
MKNMKFTSERIEGSMKVVAYPVNESAYYACKLVNRDFLTQEEAKIFQKLGFTIEVIQEKTNTTEDLL